MANEVSANQVLANEVLAPLPEVALSEPDYRAFCTALEASARGRAFLAEYAKRNRHADTEKVLAALDRLEAQVARQAASTEADRIRQELRALLAALTGAQPVIDASPAAIKAAKLAALIGFVQHRIDSIVAPARESSALPPEVAALILLDTEQTDAPTPEPARAHLVVVPRADEPELPIPAPAAGPPPAIVLVQVAPEAPPPDIIQRSAAIIPEVNLFDGAPVKPAAVEPVVIETVEVEAVAAPIEPPAPIADPEPPPGSASAPITIRLIPADAGIVTSELRLEDFGTEQTPIQPLETTPVQPVILERQPPADPLAHIMALSEEERIALFS
jgi:hypothetical protein